MQTSEHYFVRTCHAEPAAVYSAVHPRHVQRYPEATSWLMQEADHAVEDNWPDSNATWGSACSTAQRSTGHTPPVSHDSTADIGAHPAASTAGLAWGTAGGQSAFAAAGLPPRKKVMRNARVFRPRLSLMSTPESAVHTFVT